ncbi:MAG: hypothetical protein NTW30_00230, partial [Candidatus Aenigmarchaeota archaeon]|nr:hypothetical protein [Candidatus Aenigmarchaeota archaeon]
ISNSGSADTKNIVIEVEPTDMIKLLENPKKEINSLTVGDSRIVNYKMFVDSSAISTNYELTVYVSYENSNKYSYKVQITVQGKPNFKILKVDTGTVNPGDEAEISVDIQNVGSGKAKRTNAEFSSTSTYIKPILAGGNVYIGDISPGEKKNIKFNILTSSDAEYDVYTGKINLTYEDESGNILIKSFDVGILVSGEPKFEIIKIEAKKDSQELSIEIANKGSAEARGIKAILLIDNKTFDVDYVTNVNIEKRTTLKFILPNANRAELELSYISPNNKKFTQTDTIVWSVPYTFPSWIIVVVVLVVVYVLWKKKWLKKIF